MTFFDFLIGLFIACLGIISLTELIYGTIRNWLRNRKNQSPHSNNNISEHNLSRDKKLPVNSRVEFVSTGRKGERKGFCSTLVVENVSHPLLSLYILLSVESLLLLCLLLAHTSSLFFVWFGVGVIVLRRMKL